MEKRTTSPHFPLASTAHTKMPKSKPIKRYIEKSLDSLRVMGLWSAGDQEFFETKFYWMYSLFVHVVIGSGFMLGLYMYLFTNFHNLELVAEIAYMALTFSIPYVKAIFCFKCWSLMKNLVKQLDQEEFQPRDEAEEKIFASNFRVHRASNVLYTLSVAVLFPLWLLRPYIVHSKSKLPFLSWYPFDIKNSWLYTVAYLHQILGLGYCSLSEWSMDLTTFAFMAYISAECEILSHRLGNIGVSGNMDEELIHHMRHHRKILLFADDVNEFMGTLNFVHFAISIFSICMFMFELSSLPTSSWMFFGVLQLQLGVSCELLIYCYFGGEVYSKSEEIANTLYAMPWIDASRDFKRNTLFFIMRTQRPMRITTLNLFLLSLPTFTTIMKSSWSFYAMLHQTQMKKSISM